ncbi:MAG: phytoene desaturase [Proteobacteria bacterium]|nr:MAG: phytoene desaturase [Pseudomonadota bacterium]
MKKLKAKPHAIVIGSGFGGLAAAIRLCARGFTVSLWEKRDKPGGRAYVYEDKGFIFDAGPTVITAPAALEELFEVAGRKMEDYVELLPVAPFYRLRWSDGTIFNYSNDVDSLKAQIGARNKGDVSGYDKFYEYSKDVFHEGYDKLVHIPFLNWWSMIKVSPQLIRLGAYRSVYSTVAKFIKDEKLREAFSFHSLLIGGNPFSSSSIYTLIHYLERKWGVFFPRGGTGALVRGLVKLFQDLGGTIHLNRPAARILTENGRVIGVEDEQGTKEMADLVVSNADVVHTYESLLKNEPLAKPAAKKYAKMRHSMSLFVLYFGTDRTYDDVAHHTVLFGPRYEGLLKEIFGGGDLPEDFSLYLHNPVVTDRSMAPPGCASFYVLSPVSHLGKSDTDWKKEAPIYAEKILAYLEANGMPDLRKHVVTQRSFTPLDFKTELNAHWGSAFSLEPILHQSAFFRAHNRDDKLKGLYFVGAGTHPGAGVPGVLNSGKATAAVIEQDYLGTGPLVKKAEARV